MTIQMNMIQTIGLAIVVLYIGKAIRSKVKILEKYCIPSPVVGGFLFSILHTILKMNDIVNFKFDTTLQGFFMIMFFTTIGFNASLKILKAGGIKVFTFLFVASLLAVFQNVVAITLSKILHINPLLALMTGSTSMTGGHGTAGAIAPFVESLGINGATTVALSAATFGLVAGSMMGGPLADRLIATKNLISKEEIDYRRRKEYGEPTKSIDLRNREEDSNISIETAKSKFANSMYIVIIAMGVGSYLSAFINSINESAQFPSYLGPLIVAAIMRNLADKNIIFKIYEKELGMVEEISLNIFLAMVLISLKLWELADLALPMLILLFAQVILIYLFAKYITFNLMGKDYDSAVISAGHCGFGMGATPNGIANMKSISEKYAYSKIAFFVVPIVGGLFIDFANVSIITLFTVFFGK